MRALFTNMPQVWVYFAVQRVHPHIWAKTGLSILRTAIYLIPQMSINCDFSAITCTLGVTFWTLCPTCDSIIETAVEFRKMIREGGREGGREAINTKLKTKFKFKLNFVFDFVLNKITVHDIVQAPTTT